MNDDFYTESIILDTEPCPWCGRSGVAIDFADDGNGNIWGAMFCTYCGARGPEVYIDDMKHLTDAEYQECKHRWDKRAL